MSIDGFKVIGGTNPVGTPVLATGDDPSLLVNLSMVNEIYLSDSPSFSTDDTSGVFPLAPQTGININPKRPWYALCETGLTAILGIIPDVTSYGSVAALSTGGDTLVPPQVINAVSYPPGDTAIYVGPISGYSYTCNVAALNNGAPTNPFYQLAFNWKDGPVPDGELINLVQINCLSTDVSPASNNSSICGIGKCSTNYLVVELHNYDTNPIDLNFRLYSSTREFDGHDWHSLNNNISSTFTYGGYTFSTPVSAPANNDVGSSPLITIAAGDSQARINGLYCGPMSLGVTTTEYPLTVQILSFTPAFTNPLVVLNTYVLTSGTLNVPVSPVRAPTVINFINGAGSSTNVSYTLSAGAS